MHDLATPAGTARVLRRFGIRPRKSLGQHFLISRRVLDRIVAAADLSADDAVLEVGAGIGTLTVALAARAGRVIAVEIDRALSAALAQTTGPYPNVTVVHGDIMALDPAALFGPAPGRRKVVANLPYQIASPLIVNLLAPALGIDRLVLTVQREVADRLAAPPGGRDYGALSVAAQYRAAVAVVGRVPPSAFFPPPAVDSAIVVLRVLPAPAVAVRDEALLFAVVRAAFAQRRKTLRNTLAAGLRLPATAVERACARAGIDPRRRGETLSLAEFAALTGAIAPLVGRRKPCHPGEEG